MMNGFSLSLDYASSVTPHKCILLIDFTWYTWKIIDQDARAGLAWVEFDNVFLGVMGD